MELFAVFKTKEIEFRRPQLPSLTCADGMRGKEGITVTTIVSARFETRMANVLVERKEIWAALPRQERTLEDFVELSVTWQRFKVATRTLVYEDGRSGTYGSL